MGRNFTRVSTASHYYDVIATDYDRLIRADARNTVVRQSVQAYFSSKVDRPVVMDFGGGTGLDLPWLLPISRKIYFCEPSPKMRGIATERVSNHPMRDRIIFLDDPASQISNWSPDISIPGKMDACLANFAVLNNIRDPGMAFEKLASVINPGGDLILNVLDTRLKTLVARYPGAFLRSFFSPEVITYTKFQGVTQSVYLHPLEKLKLSANPYFELSDTVRLKASGFLLVHLKRR